MTHNFYVVSEFLLHVGKTPITHNFYVVSEFLLHLGKTPMTHNFYVVSEFLLHLRETPITQNFYVVRNELHGSQCYCSYTTTRKSDKIHVVIVKCEWTLIININ